MGSKKSSIGCLFWIALILLVLVVFLFNKKNIQTVLQQTGLLQQITHEKQAEPAPEVTVSPPKTTVPNPDIKPVDTTTTPKSQPPASTQVVVTNQDTTKTTATPTSTSTPVSTPNLKPQEKLRQATLYFVYVDAKGNISLKTVDRPVKYQDSPLTDTLKALLEGLSPAELGMGLISLVPEGTKVLGVSVKDGTAYINFNESFRFNSFGQQGYASQLKQVVYTATEFQTVKNVQILVDGKTVSYLGPESPYVGKPLSRAQL